MKILLSILISLTSSGLIEAQVKLNHGDLAPEFKKTSARGSSIELYQMSSQLILLDFWAGWCKPCIKTIISTLNPIYIKYDREQLEIIGISYDKSESKWLKAIDKFDVPWIHIYDGDNNEILEMYGVQIIPAYYLIDSNNKIVGSNILSSELEAKVEEYFRQKE